MIYQPDDFYRVATYKAVDYPQSWQPTSVLFAEAILFNKDEERAIKLINKGAKLNHQYSQIGNHAYTFLPLQNFFNPDRSHKITVTTGTHWIHANQKGLGRVKQALVRAGADTMGQGKKYQ